MSHERRCHVPKRSMTFVGVIATLCVLLLEAAGAAPPQSPDVLYADAIAKEKAVRTALAAPQPPETVLKAVRTVVEQYETVVRAYPTSGYCDDALWRGGQLSLDAFELFGHPRDKDTAVRLLRALTSQYPTSRFAKQVVATAPARPPATEHATITAIRRTLLPDVVRVTIELDSEVVFHEERLSDPARVFIDLSSTRAVPPLVDQTLRFDGDTDAVRQIRLGRHPNNTTRVVLEAAGVSSFSVYPLYSPYRLVIDCVRETPPAITAKPAPAAAVREPAINDAPAIATTPVAPLPAVPLTPPVLPSAPARNLTGGFSIARQLGLGVSRIVIDPGHGGHDPGAKGNGISEAELVLDVALRLEKLLAKVPGVEVVLTRRTDDYVGLQERTAIANREGADLFLSIHANASTNTQARGVESYFLNFATSLNAASVAARENAASGQAMAALPDFLKLIALNNKRDESRDLATLVQRSLVGKLVGANKNIKDLGVKQAPFVVLAGAAMPSVLTEISFVSNAQDARLLRGASYRQRIADALFTAIRRYQTSLQNVGTIAGGK